MNMYDYLHWRGDLTFKQSPFNLVDNLILSYITYTDLVSVFDDEHPCLTIKQASDLFYQSHTIEQVKAVKSFVAEAPLVMLEAAKTNRFGSLLIHDFVDVIDKETTIQFSAMQYDIDEHTIYAAYRGTDDTLVGWQEDFQLTYKIVNAQRMAAEYLNKCTYEGKKLLVGGHSKGGNLALYAAAMCSDEVKEKIVQIYNNDGPNLYDEMIDPAKIQSILDREIRIVPEFSVFGLIFDNHPANQHIVKSDEKLIAQHATTSWQIEGPAFVETESVSKESVYIQEALNNFLADTNLEEREQFITAFFKAVGDAGYTSMSEFATIDLASIVKMIRNLALTRQDEVYNKVANRLTAVLKEVYEAEVNNITSTIAVSVKTALESLDKDLKSRRKEISNNAPAAGPKKRTSKKLKTDK